MVSQTVVRTMARYDSFMQRGPYLTVSYAATFMAILWTLCKLLFFYKLVNYTCKTLHVAALPKVHIKIMSNSMSHGDLWEFFENSFKNFTLYADRQRDIRNMQLVSVTKTLFRSHKN